MRRQFAAPFKVALDQDLRVGVARPENATPSLQVLPQSGVVVDFAIEAHHHAVVERGHGLDGAGGVHDAQAARRHGRARHRLNDRIGDVAAVGDGAHDASDQGARLQAPVDRHRYAELVLRRPIRIAM